MIENPDFENIKLISNKRMSSFSLHQRMDVFFIKVRDYSSFALFIFIIQFVRSIYNYKTDNHDLFNLIFFGALLVIIILSSTFMKTTQNIIEIDVPNEILKIKSRNIIGRFTRKKIVANFENIQSFRCKRFRTVSRIFITTNEKEFMLLDVRNRNGKDSDSLDSKTDGEIVVTCLENIFEIN